MTRQPLLHNLIVCLAAPTQVLSSASGDLVSNQHGEGAQGVWHGDLRVLSDVRLEINGQPPEPIATRAGSQEAVFTALARNVGAEVAQSHDPQVRVDRARDVSPGRVRESITVTSVLPEAVEVSVVVALASDGAAMDRVKLGDPASVRPFAEQVDSTAFGWAWGDLSATLTAAGAALDSSEDRTQGFVRWQAQLPARGSVTFDWLLDISDQEGTVLPAPEAGALEVERLADAVVAELVAAGVTEHRLRPWLVRSLADLNGLRMATAEAPGLAFFAAGAPWYLTLFGRDSIWAARLLLELDLGHAVSTLQTLARYQGTKLDPDSAEAPGKIIHEVRRAAIEAAGFSLPPRYYGTVDATPLWICLLHDAWRQGMAAEQVAELLPNLQAALEWMARFGDADGDGFLEYIDESGHGLANQGWKDSADSVRFANGDTAVGPVALCEVQGYAYEAAVKGAALLDAFELPGADRWRSWAAQLADRFRAAFWCGPQENPYPALALDRDKRPVDALTSNVGHLLGTGILSRDEERAVAELLASPAMDSGLGLRTMSSEDGAYSPLSYHCGSVWPHDTAIVLRGMLAAGLTGYAGGLIEGLLQASVAFEQRLPELWSGEGAAGVPYPAACRPQAWSAASAVTVATAMLARARA